MATNHQHGNGDAGNPSVTFDSSDLGARGILIFFVVLGMFAIAMNLVVVGLWAGLSKATEKHDAEISPLAPKTVTPRAEIMMNTANINTQKFPEPRLQVNDTTDMQRFLLKETSALTADPWQDAQGNVHLPIDQAMKLAATRIPVRGGGAAALPNYPGVGGEGSQPAEADAKGQPQAQSEEAPVAEPKAPAGEPKEQ